VNQRAKYFQGNEVDKNQPPRGLAFRKRLSINQLPPDVARKIAYVNASTLYKFKH